MSLWREMWSLNPICSWGATGTWRLLEKQLQVFLKTVVLEGHPCSSRWPYKHPGRAKRTQWVKLREDTWSWEGIVVGGVGETRVGVGMGRFDLSKTHCVCTWKNLKQLEKKRKKFYFIYIYVIMYLYNVIIVLGSLWQM